MHSADCVHNLFERHAASTPDAPAVVMGGELLTFGDLARNAEALKCVLLDRGVGPESIVGVYCERSPLAITAILAVLEAGGAYAPIDPAHPAERLAYTIADARMPLVLTTRRLRSRLPADIRVVDLDEPTTPARERSRQGTPPRPDNAALVVYTSGSTGAPKGVVISHRALVRRLTGAYPYSPGDVHKASLSVIAHVSEVLLPLAMGAPVLIVPHEQATDPLKLVAELVRHGTQRVVLVPSQLRAMLGAGEEVIRQLSRLRAIVIGGDAPTKELLDLAVERLPTVSLQAGYGLTETTAMVSMGRARSTEGVAAGDVLPGSRVYVLDERLRPTQAGEVGDIYVASEQLARGYLQRAALTSLRFVADPFAGDGGRMYRTGDRGRRTVDGMLQVLGREDDQVKIKGFRVDCGEVARTMEQHPSVRQAMVVPVSHPDGVRLAAFVTASDPATVPDPIALRRHLRQRLPWQMVPGVIAKVSQLPTLPNGKIDRQALIRTAPEQASARDEYTPPRTEREAVLAAIWSEVLALPSAGARDDFFELGGTSLLAARVLSRVLERWDVELAIGDLAENPTPETLAEVIDARSPDS
jgi:amino acid adenylation domain-containing protein